MVPILVVAFVVSSFPDSLVTKALAAAVAIWFLYLWYLEFATTGINLISIFFGPILGAGIFAHEILGYEYLS